MFLEDDKVKKLGTFQKPK